MKEYCVVLQQKWKAINPNRTAFKLYLNKQISFISIQMICSNKQRPMALFVYLPMFGFNDESYLTINERKAFFISAP